MELKLARALLGIVGLLVTMVTLWLLDAGKHSFEEKVGMKISTATLFFSIMMFTPLVDMSGGVISLGILALPSLKWVFDAVIMAFLASSLKDIIEEERKEDSG